MGNKTLKQKFQALKQNNIDQDWNDSVFQQTMVDAFFYCANQHIEELLKSPNKKMR